MNSFTLLAIGSLGRNPDLTTKGEGTCTRFCLVGNDYVDGDEEGGPREIVTSAWFVAYGAIGDAIARQARKGDQLIIKARIQANNWIDKRGGKNIEHTFVVQGFRFGARRGSPGSPVAQICGCPPEAPVQDAAHAITEVAA